MAATETRIAPDSATELHDLIGDDATATFESDPKFIDSDPTEGASSSNIAVQRDTDDLEDSDEEEDELEDEDEEYEEDDDEDEEEDEDEDEEDDDDDDEDEEDDDAVIAKSVDGAVQKEGAAAGRSSSDDLERAEDDDEEDDASDAASTDRTIDAALRMSAMVAVVAEFAAIG
ncbi:MAG: hypothetical protein HIU91_09840 [Acidobacteria bacterium]|nr:hypothetical protein [Acidobacteriota bacterium]